MPTPVLRAVERGSGENFFLFRGDERIPGAPESTGSLIDPNSLLGRARAIADLDDDAYPPLHDFGTLEDDSGAKGKAYVCWKQEQGETLRARLDRSVLELPEAVLLVSHVSEAVSSLHRAGWEHGFLRPASVFLSSFGGIRLLAAALEPADLYAHSSLAYDEELAALGWAAAAYLAPEQLPALPGDIPREADGSTRTAPDHRSDIWALGVMLYEAASGQLPFQGKTFEAMARSIRGTLPEPFSAVPGIAPQLLETILAKCLAHDVTARYQNVEELHDDLEQLAAQQAATYAPVAAAGRVSRARTVGAVGDQQAPPSTPQRASRGTDRTPRAAESQSRFGAPIAMAAVDSAAGTAPFHSSDPVPAAARLEVSSSKTRRFAASTLGIEFSEAHAERGAQGTVTTAVSL